MAIPKSKWIWFNGEFVPWEEAKIHVLSHVVHYGSSIFEGFRCYDTRKGPACFRLRNHMERMFNSCKIYRMEVPFSREEMEAAVLETIRVNGLRECYIRPIVFRGYETLGVNPLSCPVDAAIAVWPWGEYLGEDTLEKGVSVRVSSWSRMAPNTLPAMAKCGGHYTNSQLIKMEAVIEGYVEAIALDSFGYVSEGSGENIFLVSKGKLYTPPFSSSILPGITRDTVMVLAKDLGYEVREQPIPREWLYIADEVFFTGSATEICPINAIDHIPIGNGRRGPITKQFQDEFFAITSGQKEDRYGWLTFV